MPLVDNKPITPTDKKNGYAVLNAAAGQTLVDLYTAPADAPVDIKVLFANNTMAATRIIRVFRHDGTTARLLFASQIASGAGTNGTTAALDLLAIALAPHLQRDVAQKGFLQLAAGEKIQVALTADAASGEVVVHAEALIYAEV